MGRVGLENVTQREGVKGVGEGRFRNVTQRGRGWGRGGLGEGGWGREV